MSPLDRSRDLSGQVALVTGASRLLGIGAATCRLLAHRGADVAFSHWRPYDAQFPWEGAASEPAELAAELQRHGVRALPIECDLAPPDAAARLLDTVELELGLPTILVNNAAHSTRDGYERLDAETIDAHYAVNMRATMLLTVEFARRFRREWGRVVNLTSGQSLGPMPEELAYAATKGAIEAFTRSLAPPLAEKGITINAVDPGPTDTGWITGEFRTELLRQMPMGRFGQPDDAARLIAWLAGPEAGWVTGQIIHSDGGMIRD